MKKAKDSDIISINPLVLGGTPVFSKTRVPVQTLFDYLEGDFTLHEFLVDFPTVKKKQALGLLKSAERLVLITK